MDDPLNDLRAALVDSLRASGAPADKARETVDLALHANAEAKRRLVEVVEAGSCSKVRLLGMQLACQLASNDLEIAVTQAIAAAEKLGINTYTANLSRADERVRT